MPNAIRAALRLAACAAVAVLATAPVDAASALALLQVELVAVASVVASLGAFYDPLARRRGDG